MRVYKDIFNDDELMSDSFPTVTVFDIIYEVQTKQITRSKVGNIDIGANPSAEVGEGGEDEGASGDNDTVTVNNLIDAHRLIVCSYTSSSHSHTNTTNDDVIFSKHNMTRNPIWAISRII